MKIAIISDTHFGYKENDSELNLDCYIAAEQAFKLAIANNADIIMMPGDIFDLEIPTQETFERTFSLLNNLIGNQKLIPKNKDKTITAIPLVVIPGTHEYRGKDYKGPVDVLESAKYIYKLEKEHVLFEKDDENVAIFGMKGVPEKVAKDVLDKIDFKPLETAKNIIMLHQSFKEFLPFDDDMIATLRLEDLPKGFDLYVNGHIHLSNIIDTENGKFVLPGSTIFTQIKKAELQKKKGITIYDTKTDAIDFVEIPIQREISLETINTENETKDQIYEKVNDIINKHKQNIKEYSIFEKQIKLKPILKIKLTGNLLSGYNKSDINEKDFQHQDLILIIDKDLDINSLEEKIKDIDIAKEKENALKQSTEIFYNNLKSAGFKNSFKPEELIAILKSDEHEKIIDKLIQNK